MRLRVKNRDKEEKVVNTHKERANFIKNNPSGTYTGRTDMGERVTLRVIQNVGFEVEVQKENGKKDYGSSDAKGNMTLD